MNILRQKYIIQQEKIRRKQVLDMNRIKNEEDKDYCVQLDYKKMKIDNEMLIIKMNLIDKMNNWTIQDSANSKKCNKIDRDIVIKTEKLKELKGIKASIENYIESKFI